MLIAWKRERYNGNSSAKNFGDRTVDECYYLARDHPEMLLAIWQKGLAKEKAKKTGEVPMTAPLDPKNESQSDIDVDDGMGYGEDWKLYQNAQGFTHLEELLITNRSICKN